MLIDGRKIAAEIQDEMCTRTLLLNEVYSATMQIGLACAFRPHTRSLDSSALRLLLLEFCRATWS